MSRWADSTYTAAMRTSFNFRAGIGMAIATLIVGVGFFVLVAGNMDMKCAADESASGCRVWLAADAAITNYTDVFRSVFAPECVGGDGPNSCIGPDVMIMGGTLLVLGFIGGGWLFRGTAMSTSQIAKSPSIETKIK